MRIRFWFLSLAALCTAACSASDAVNLARVAASGNPVAAAESLATSKAVGYAVNPAAAVRDVKRFADLLAAFSDAIANVWGPAEVRLPTPRTYVKYTQSYLSRAWVDFDKGLVTVETVDRKQPLPSLKSAIVATLLTPDDPRAVDLYSPRPIPIGPTPFLLGEVRDNEGKDIRWVWRAERFADWLIANHLQVRSVKTGHGSALAHAVTIPMVRDHLHIRAAKYRHLVEEQSRKFGISRNLIYAIMKVESDFNPFAINSVPAVGLMQVVPKTAGSDVYRFLTGKNGAPTIRGLMSPPNNILYGTAYLHLLNYRYLSGMRDPVSREYCVIAGYNGGPGAVNRVFGSTPRAAASRVNGLPPSQVYKKLLAHLPSAETRRYLTKVLKAKKLFVNFQG